MRCRRREPYVLAHAAPGIYTDHERQMRTLSRHEIKLNRVDETTEFTL
jgi:hypothetical protein